MKLPYETMAEMMSSYLHAHQEGPLTSQDTLALGIIASLANFVVNPTKKQWEDILQLATTAIECYPKTMGDIAVPIERANPEEIGKLNREQLFSVSRMGHRILSLTLIKPPEIIMQLAEQAVLTPFDIHFPGYTKLSAFCAANGL